MENYLVDNEKFINILDDNIQEVFKTATNFKDITFKIKNETNKSFYIYPFYINENLNVKINFEKLNEDFKITILFKSRTNEKKYYEGILNLENEFDLKIFQNKETIAVYINNSFIAIIKENIISYGTIAVQNCKDIAIKPINLISYLPSKDLGWSYIQSEDHSYIFHNEKNEYVIENIFNEDGRKSSILIKEIDNLKVNNDYTFTYKNNKLKILLDGKEVADKYTFKASKETINIEISNENKGIEVIDWIQLEEGVFNTSYMENKDIINYLDKSIFKVPTKNNIDRIAGTLVYEYVPNINQKEFTIFEIGDFKLIYKEDRYILYSVTSSMPNKQITLIQPLKERKTWIVWTWINNSHKLLHIQANEIKSSKNETGEMNGIFNTMNFAPDKYMSGIINNIDIYNLDSFYLQETTENFLKYQKENSQNKIFGLNLSSQIEFFKKPFLESSLVPLDGSPILVRNNEGEMQRQFFFDENTGKYRDYNEEYLTYLGNREIKVSYNQLDEKFNPTIKVISGMNKGLEIGQPVSIKDNVIKMTIGNEESQALFGEEIVVTYKIKNSYNIEFNEKSANDSYIINLDNPNGEDIIVTQEGNRFSNKKLAKEIELNPILNPRHEGFLYITKNSQTTNSFRIQVSSDMVSANGMDSADIMIEAIDEYGNEVLSPYLDIYIIDDSGIETNQYGSITPIINYETMKARNTSGRLYMRYNSPYLSIKEINREKKIYIVVYDRFNKIGTQISLILKPSSIENKNTLLSISRNSNIPFEYFSRYFERNNIPQEVLKVLDYDNNGQLTREDLNQLIINQYNLTEMIGATESLKSLEEF